MEKLLASPITGGEIVMNKKLVMLFKRVSGDDNSISNMPEEFKRGWYDGFVVGRETQRNADIEAGEKLIPPPERSKEKC